VDGLDNNWTRISNCLSGVALITLINSIISEILTFVHELNLYKSFGGKPMYSFVPNNAEIASDDILFSLVTIKMWLVLLFFTLTNMGLVNLLTRLLFYSITKQSLEDNIVLWIGFSAGLFILSEVLTQLWLPKMTNMMQRCIVT
jgi:hypothetical protein